MDIRSPLLLLGWTPVYSGGVLRPGPPRYTDFARVSTRGRDEDTPCDMRERRKSTVSTAATNMTEKWADTTTGKVTLTMACGR